MPTLVHRYSWPIREAIEHLLDDVVGDCEAWQVRIEGEQLVIDVVGPATGAIVVDLRGERMKRAGIDLAFIEDGSPAENMEEEAFAEADASNAAAAKSEIATPEANTAPAEPPRKGGALARQAGIICGEKGFWTFITRKCGVTIESANEAAFWLKERCGVESRIDFDHDAGKAANFREIDGAYRLWLDGFD